MDKKKIVAVVTGAISILIGIAYLVLVQLIDFRGEMILQNFRTRQNTTN